MTPAFEKLQKQLKQLPGLGFRSSERIALHLLVEKPAQLPALVAALEEASRVVKRCARCGNLAESVTGDGSSDGADAPSSGTGDSPVGSGGMADSAMFSEHGRVARATQPICAICADARRDRSLVCVVEHVPDLVAMERSGAYRGVYHVLHGKLSPISGVGPEQLNFAALFARVKSGEARELILALSNDIEGEATCHYLTQHLPKSANGESSASGESGGSGGSGGGESVKTTRIGFGLPSGGGVLYADSVTLKSALEGRREYL